jgi:hypothetical protein
MQLTQNFKAELADPIKTTVVQDQRCMTTWALRKPTPTPNDDVAIPD